MSYQKHARKLNFEQLRQLAIAQKKLERGVWSFKRYSMHLSEFVYGV